MVCCRGSFSSAQTRITMNRFSAQREDFLIRFRKYKFQMKNHLIARQHHVQHTAPDQTPPLRYMANTT